jgi:hypothetical protein
VCGRGDRSALGARYGIAPDSGPPSADARHDVLELVRRFGLTG